MKLFYVAGVTFIDRRVPQHLCSTGQTLFNGATFGLGSVAGQHAASDLQKGATGVRRLLPPPASGRPRVKSYVRINSITFPSYGDGCKLTRDRLYVQGVGIIKVTLHRPLRRHHWPRCGLSLPRDQVSAMLVKKSGLGSSPQAQT